MNDKTITIKACAEPSFMRSAEEILRKQLKKRHIGFNVNGEAETGIELCLDAGITDERFLISGSSQYAKITAGSASGMLAGIGKLLRTSDFSSEGMSLSQWRGESAPSSPVRGIQMDTHFCNFYHMASEAELSEYVEDLALWGINCFEFVFPLIDLTGWTDPEIMHITRQIKAIYDTAKKLALRAGLEIVPNQDFVDRREEFTASKNCEPVRRRGNNGNNICPSMPGALAYLEDTYGRVIRHLIDNGIKMDFICFWPYDEGGCSCEKCAPWGANGYLKASEAILKRVREYLPDVEVVLSTWLYDTPSEQEEWSGLYEKIADMPWINYVLADSHTDFPKYPLTHKLPGGIPLLNYPEISMWALFPWGGYGANPLPKRFERLWKQVKDTASGGIAYSEGIFDDINKCVVCGFYWDKDAELSDILKEYIDFYFGNGIFDEVWEAIQIIERNHTETAVGNERAITRESNTRAVTPEVCTRAEQALSFLKTAAGKLDERATGDFRWRILYIRAALDCLRFRRALDMYEKLRDEMTWTDILTGSDEAKSLLKELSEIYHSRFDTDTEIHPMFKCVRPALPEVMEM